MEYFSGTTAQVIQLIIFVSYLAYSRKIGIKNAHEELYQVIKDKDEQIDKLICSYEKNAEITSKDIEIKEKELIQLKKELEEKRNEYYKLTAEKKEISETLSLMQKQVNRLELMVAELKKELATYYCSKAPTCLCCSSIEDTFTFYELGEENE